MADPYRWLEDTDSADTHDWVEAENKLTFGYLDQIPYRRAIRERLTKLWNYERFTAPGAAGRTLFLPAQQRTAEPERAAGGGVAERASRGCCSIRTRCRRMARWRWRERRSPTTAS